MHGRSIKRKNVKFCRSNAYLVHNFYFKFTIEKTEGMIDSESISEEDSDIEDGISSSSTSQEFVYRSFYNFQKIYNKRTFSYRILQNFAFKHCSIHGPVRQLFRSTFFFVFVKIVAVLAIRRQCSKYVAPALGPSPRTSIFNFLMKFINL